MKQNKFIAVLASLCLISINCASDHRWGKIPPDTRFDILLLQGIYDPPFRTPMYGFSLADQKSFKIYEQTMALNRVRWISERNYITYEFEHKAYLLDVYKQKRLEIYRSDGYVSSSYYNESTNMYYLVERYFTDLPTNNESSMVFKIIQFRILRDEVVKLHEWGEQSWAGANLNIGEYLATHFVFNEKEAELIMVFFRPKPKHELIIRFNTRTEKAEYLGRIDTEGMLVDVDDSGNLFFASEEGLYRTDRNLKNRFYLYHAPFKMRRCSLSPSREHLACTDKAEKDLIIIEMKTGDTCRVPFQHPIVHLDW